jgi:small subunit ribosomal protein S13
MARIVGVDLPKNKRGEIALTYIYGVGRSTARKVLAQAGVDKDIKVQDWNDEQITAIRKILVKTINWKVSSVQKCNLHQAFNRYWILQRHETPSRDCGQRTENQNNARTRKGRKKTVANKKKATK